MPDCVAIADDTAAEDGGDAYLGYHRDSAPWLTVAHVGDVHLDRRQPDGVDRVADGVGVVSECAGVDDNTIRVASGVEPIDDVTFMVRLERLDLASGLDSPTAASGIEFLEGRGAIDLRRTRSDEVEIRTVDDDESHGR